MTHSRNMYKTVWTEILLSHSRALVMGGVVEKSSATISCLCPPDCCSPEAEKDDGHIWFLIKVLFQNLFILKVFPPHPHPPHHQLPLLLLPRCSLASGLSWAPLLYLEEELLLVFLITFGNHHHQEPSCSCSAKLLKKRTRKTSVSSEDGEKNKKSSTYKLLKKKKKVRKSQ